MNNTGEDPNEGRKGLVQELAPALRAMPGFVSTLLLTAYERGRGVAVVVFETEEQAEQMVGGLTMGREIRAGVFVTGAEVLEVSASA